MREQILMEAYANYFGCKFHVLVISDIVQTEYLDALLQRSVLKLRFGR